MGLGPEDLPAEPSPFTRGQIDIIVVFERTGAALSIIGVLLIFFAFAAFKRLRSVPNTFIVFASIANLGASAACLIGYSGVTQGEESHLCQAQAFMFELFMQSDPWWSFAMAVNVYMVFFFAANPNSFLRYWWAYFFVCYGVPFIPALWLILVRDSRGGVYGNATIWCWIDKDWSNLRIYTYYLPIWVCITLSACIYISVGYYVFNQRNQLRNLSLSNPATRDPPDQRDSGEKNLFTNAAVMGRIATEVTQVTTVHHTHACGSGDGPKSPSAATVNWFDGPVENQSFPELGLGHQPSSLNPYHTVTRITADPVPKRPFWTRFSHAYNRWCSKFNHMDPVKLAYLRTSFVFAISVLVTWTPSSINRVHDVIHPGTASFGLNLASGIVLPLQGVWNTFIFFTTSWKTLREEVRLRWDMWKGLPRGHQAATAARTERERAVELERRIGGRDRIQKGRDDVSLPDSSVTSSTMRVMRDGSFTSL
ncbi:uncharacterized protein BCR38DRAFT_354367 [Pseudomassariella vexata]|uniref:G-protein coupled receptors family 2 profile 2 domain-containing protein n=1 Tax=Pseudomassariella vexata TaxID=1141098 RepID=A0A1Y2DDV4_9PEZI|nr:uncharacterized protein BCR38DRAFT_354367 [Pseudomassariella vexata]ORY57462.1 hypothetical protein BCR38DRAFT_354367 [Pseudomassariella vexata]